MSTAASERIRAWGRSGNSDDLWPDLPAATRLAALGRLRSAISDVVGGAAQRPALMCTEPVEVRALGVAAFTAGIGPLFGHWMGSGVVDASPQARDVFQAHLDHGVRRIAMLRAHVAELVRAMKTAGVDPILLKGMHTGAEVFPHPSTRPASDIDLLVRPAEIDAAAHSLTGLGFTETSSSSFAHRSVWTHASASRVVQSVDMDVFENPWTVDLHRALEREYFRGTRRDLGAGVFETERRIDINGESVRVLDEPYLLTFLALHTSGHFRSMQLIRLLEIVWVVRHDSGRGRIDWDEQEALLRRTDTGRFVYPALALADELAPRTVDARLLRRLVGQVSPRMLRVMDRIRRAQMGLLNERSTDVLLAWAVGPRELASNALEIVLPSDDLLGSLPATIMRRVGIVMRSRGRS